MDEPTSVLDPVGRIDVRNIILELKKQGTTIFLSSHLLLEVEKVCDKAAIIDKGFIVAMGTIDELARSKIRYIIELDKVNETLQNILISFDCDIINIDNEKIESETDNANSIPQIVKAIVENGFNIYELKKAQELENVFLKVIGEEHF